MSYTFLLDAGEESSAECFSGIPACALSRLSPIADESCSNGNGTESCPDSPSGTMCELSTVIPGAEGLMSCAPEFHASGSALLEKGKASSTPMFTLHFCGLFARLCQPRYSWKTPHSSLFEGLDNFSGTWPQWGIMRGGECFALTMSDYRITAPESGWLPTPSGTSNHGKNHVAGSIQEWGGSWNSLRGTAIGKRKSQELEELLLGWPVGWSDLTPLETAKFQAWLRSHGKP